MTTKCGGRRAAAVRAPGRGRRHGLTLVELLVVLAVMATLAGVVGLAWRDRVPPTTWRDRATGVAARARADAIARGAPVTFVAQTPTGPADGTAYPDGSVVADARIVPDRLAGMSARVGGDQRPDASAGASTR